MDKQNFLSKPSMTWSSIYLSSSIAACVLSLIIIIMSAPCWKRWEHRTTLKPWAILVTCKDKSMSIIVNNTHRFIFTDTKIAQGFNVVRYSHLLQHGADPTNVLSLISVNDDSSHGSRNFPTVEKNCPSEWIGLKYSLDF